MHAICMFLCFFYVLFLSVNIVTQKMYSFEAVNKTKLPYDVNYSQKLMSKSLKLEEVSITVKSITPAEGVFYYFKSVMSRTRKYSNIRILPWPNI